MKKYSNYIDGSWILPASGAYGIKTNPADPSEELGEFPLSNEEDVEAAISAAYEVKQSWADTPAPQRGTILYRLAELLDDATEELAKIITFEQGKSYKESVGEVKRAAVEARYMAGEATRILGHTYPSERNQITSQTILEPLGVVAAISPWNFPIVTPIRKIAPALAFGNTVVFKPATDTPWSAVRLMDLFEEAGFPPGVVNLVIGSGSKVGNRLVQDKRVTGITFTGSTEIGLKIYQEAAKRNAKVQLELGGKNPAVVWDYKNLEKAANEIVGAAFTCSGQRCTAISRVIVSEELADNLVKHLKEGIKKIKVGNGLDDEVTMGPLVSESHFRTVEEYSELAKNENCQLVTGGQAVVKNPGKDGYYFAPTLYDFVDETSALAREEMFGPILPVLRKKSYEEAIRIVNDTQYGLAASLFCKDMKKVRQFINGVEAGMIHINHGTASQAHVPFGGIKQSGQGAYSIGPSARDFYTNIKSVYIAWEG